MARPVFSPRKYVSRDDALIQTINEKSTTLERISEIDFAEFITELNVRSYKLPVNLRQAGNSNWTMLRHIEQILDARLDKVEPGFKFGGTIQTGTTDPYVARRGELVLCDVSAGSFTVQLPDPTLADNKIHMVNVKLVVPGTGFEVTVVALGGALIDGDASLAINVEDINVTFFVNEDAYKAV